MPGRVLFVDDDQVFAEASAQLLRGAGYEVQIAPDYRLALQVLESNALVDLLVCDIVMPDRVNGLALGRMARLRRPTSRSSTSPVTTYPALRTKR